MIDALLVTLGLDAGGMKKGAADANAALDSTTKGVVKADKASEDAAKRWTKGAKDEADLRRKNAAEQTKQFKDSSEETKKLAAGLNAVKGELLALLAAFTAGAGLKDFIANTITGTAALGRLSTNLGISAQQLAGWEGVARSMGGTTQGAAQALQALSDIAFQIATTGTSDKVGLMRVLGLDAHSLDDSSQGLLNIAAGLDRLKAQGATRQYLVHVIQGMGISDPGVTAALLSGKGAVQALLQQEEALNPVTAAQTKAAEDAVTAWANLGTQLSNVGIQITTALMPAIQAITGGLKWIADWAQAHPQLAAGIFAALTGAIFALAGAVTFLTLASSPWLLIIIAISGVLGGLYFLVQDFFSYVQTGKSVLDWGPFIPVINALRGAFGNLWGALVSVFNSAKELLALIPPGVWKAIGSALETAIIGPLTSMADLINVIADGIKGIVALLHGDAKGAWADFSKAAGDWLSLKDHSAGNDIAIGASGQGAGQSAASGSGPSGGGAGAPQGSSAVSRRAAQLLSYLKSRGISDAAAQGAVAGAIAENHALDPGAFNSGGGGHGALGIGQWRGQRLAALIARFGPHPTFTQQSQFLADELLGGDSGGAAVTGAGSAAAAAMAYILKFMRPGAGASGDLSRVARALPRVAQFDSGIIRGAGANPGVIASNSNSRSSHVQAATHIGSININAQGNDAGGISRKIGAALAENQYVPDFATGLV